MSRPLINLLRILAVVGLLVFTLLPIYWIVITAFRPDSEVLSVNGTLWPQTLTLENYVAVFQDGKLARYMGNSVIVGLATTLLCLLLGLPASYALSRLSYPAGLAANVRMWVLSNRFIPPFAIAIPLFLLFRDLRLLDTLHGLILAHTVFALPFTMWILQAGFDELPKEIEEAARIDGSSRLGVFWRIAVPLVRPTIACAAIFSLFLSWNEFLFALLLTVTDASTVPLLLAQFLTDRSLQWGKIAALATVASLPVVIFLLFAQKYLVQGLTAGAVKS